MKRLFNIKVIVLLAIIAGGTYVLTDSLPITAGVAILAFAVDALIGNWLDRMSERYFAQKKTDNNGETH